MDKPLRTEAAIVAALTVLEASRIEDFDFKRLRDALFEYVKDHPELKEKNLQEVLDELPWRWFLNLEAEMDQELSQSDERLKALNGKKREKKLTPEEKKEQKRLQDYLPKSSWRWERSPAFWMQSIRYLLSLIRHRRPDFDDYTLREQIFFLDNYRRFINKYLEAQRDHTAFLEYGTPTGNPTRVVELAQKQIKAAVLADVEDCNHLEIANILGVDKPKEYEDNKKSEAEAYKGIIKIPEAEALVRDGRKLLNNALKDAGGWKRRAREIRAEADRYNALSQEEKSMKRQVELMDQML
ncbi:MAG: hypothetical protein LC751_10305, partial [Actinobacteria bacterium]|nr:hypothetical protein [Actinomycetota bacterium]